MDHGNAIQAHKRIVLGFHRLSGNLCEIIRESVAGSILQRRGQPAGHIGKTFRCTILAMLPQIHHTADTHSTLQMVRLGIGAVAGGKQKIVDGCTNSFRFHASLTQRLGGNGDS